MKYIKYFENIDANTMHFYHGGNLDTISDYITHRKGRAEFGAGLYATGNIDVARKYAKGSRKLYEIWIEKGNDIRYCFLDKDKCLDFINSCAIASKRKELKEYLDKLFLNDKIKAFMFNNILLNKECIKSTQLDKLRKFYVDNGIDYEIFSSSFGFLEEMIVLYNMNKIKEVKRIK